MGSSWWNGSSGAKSRPDARGRTALRPRFEGLETRLLPAITFGVVNRQLRVNDTSDVDTVTLDHAGSTTLVNGVGFPDSAIANGILITVGTGVGHFDTVNIRATAIPVTVDGQFDIGTATLGADGNLQGVAAPVTFTEFNGADTGTLTIDDSADTSPRSATLDVANGQVVLAGLSSGTVLFDQDGISTLNINGGIAGNTFVVQNIPVAGSGVLTTVNLRTGLGKDTTTVRGSTLFSSLDIQGQDGRDSVLVDLNSGAGRHTGFVTVANRQSFTDLTIDDSADATARDVEVNNFFRTTDPSLITVAGFTSTGEIGYRALDVSTVTVNAGRGGNTFTIDDAARAATGYQLVLNTGPGNDVVKIQDTRDGVIVNGQNGRDSVSIGSDDLPGGSMTGILGSIFVNNAGSFTSLLLNDTVDQVGRIVTLDVSGTIGLITGLSPAPITYRVADLGALDVRGGAGADTFFVRATQGLAQPTINAGRGDDTIVVGSAGLNLDTIQSALTVDGGTGFDRLVVQDQGSHVAHTYTTTATQVRRTSASTPTVIINYAAIDSLQVNKGGPTTNPPPLVKGLAFPRSIKVGKAARLTGHLDDADGDKNLTLTVDWGDGSAPTAIKPGRKRFHLNHKYAGAGTYTVRAIWTDSTGESNFRDLQLAVASARRRR